MSLIQFVFQRVNALNTVIDKRHIYLTRHEFESRAGDFHAAENLTIFANGL